MMAGALTALVAIAVAGLLVCEARDARRAAFYWKALASAGFVALAVVLGGWRGSAFARWVLVGLVLAAGGDVALAISGQRAFFIGLVLFLLGHVAYVVACAERVPPSAWLAGGAALPVIASGAAFAWLFRHLGNMRVPVGAYVVTITTMVIAAMSVHRAGGERASLLLGGAVLFYLSDLSVARDRFVARSFVNRAWGLPAYYAGQVLMAWAAG